MDPINYTGMQTVVDPAQALLGGIRTGAGLEQAQFQQQQQQAALAAQQRQRQDLQALTSNPNPTAQDYANYTLRNPSQADAAKQSFALLDTQQQKQKIGVASQVYSALSAGRPELADQILAQQEQAQANGGSQADLHGTQALRQLIKTSPQAATHTAGIFLSSAMGPDNFARSFGNVTADQQQQQNQPLQQAKGQADINNINSQIDTRQQDLDIKRADVQVKALQAKLQNAKTDLERTELTGKIQDAQTARDQLAKTKTTTGNALVASSDNALDTISRLESHPGLEGILGARGVVPNIPGSDAADAQAVLKTLKGQAFLNAFNSLKGGGQITEIEGEKATDALQSLDTKQSPEQFKQNLTVVKDMINKARTGAINQYGIQAGSHEGVVFQHPTRGSFTQSDINAAAQRNGVTPEKMLQLIKSAQ